MLFSELENYTLYQAELNVITINENHEIFEVPGQNENSRLQKIILSLRVYVTMSEIYEIE
jgi:hypothetical protein